MKLPKNWKKAQSKLIYGNSQSKAFFTNPHFWSLAKIQMYNTGFWNHWNVFVKQHWIFETSVSECSCPSPLPSIKSRCSNTTFLKLTSQTTSEIIFVILVVFRIQRRNAFFHHYFCFLFFQQIDVNRQKLVLGMWYQEKNRWVELTNCE